MRGGARMWIQLGSADRGTLLAHTDRADAAVHAREEESREAWPG